MQAFPGAPVLFARRPRRQPPCHCVRLAHDRTFASLPPDRYRLSMLLSGLTTPIDRGLQNEGIGVALFLKVVVARGSGLQITTLEQPETLRRSAWPDVQNIALCLADKWIYTDLRLGAFNCIFRHLAIFNQPQTLLFA